MLRSPCLDDQEWRGALKLGDHPRDCWCLASKFVRRERVREKGRKRERERRKRESCSMSWHDVDGELPILLAPEWGVYRTDMYYSLTRPRVLAKNRRIS